MPKVSCRHGLLAERAARAIARTADKGPSGSKEVFRGSWTDHCDRRIYYQRKGVRYSNRFSAGVMMKFARGNIFEPWIRDVLIPKYMGKLVTEAQQLVWTTAPGNVKIEGHIDGILRDPHGREAPSLLEIKTTSMYGYKGMCQEGFLNRDHWTWGYYVQAQRYAWLWNHAPQNKNDTVKRVVLLVFNVNGDEDKKTGVPFRDFRFKLDERVVLDSFSRLARIEEAVVNDALPERYYTDRKDWHCQGCTYLDTCWEIRRHGAAPHPSGPEIEGALAASGVETG